MKTANEHRWKHCLVQQEKLKHCCWLTSGWFCCSLVAYHKRPRVPGASCLGLTHWERQRKQKTSFVKFPDGQMSKINNLLISLALNLLHSDRSTHYWSVLFPVTMLWALPGCLDPFIIKLVSHQRFREFPQVGLQCSCNHIFTDTLNI